MTTGALLLLITFAVCILLGLVSLIIAIISRFEVTRKLLCFIIPSAKIPVIRRICLRWGIILPLLGFVAFVILATCPVNQFGEINLNPSTPEDAFFALDAPLRQGDLDTYVKCWDSESRAKMTETTPNSSFGRFMAAALVRTVELFLKHEIIRKLELPDRIYFVTQERVLFWSSINLSCVVLTQEGWKMTNRFAGSEESMDLWGEIRSGKCYTKTGEYDEAKQTAFYKNLQNAIDPKVPEEIRIKARDTLQYRAHHYFFQERKTLSLLLKAIKIPDEEIKIYVLQIITYTKNPEAFNVLKQIIQGDPSVKVKAQAALSLGLTGHKDAFSVLQDLVMSDKQPYEVRASAVLCIGELDSKSANTFLRNHFKKEEDENVRATILDAIFNYHDETGNSTLQKFPSGDKTLILFLINLLDDPSIQFKFKAFGYLNNFIKKDKSFDISFFEKDKMILWWDANKDYLCWSEEDDKFVIDEEAKKAGIPTEEYRKTHPWSKESKLTKKNYNYAIQAEIGYYFLLKKGKQFGAAKILREISDYDGGVEYEWCFQEDGSGNFLKSNCTNGRGKAFEKYKKYRRKDRTFVTDMGGVRVIKCGPFVIRWSKSNWLYLKDDIEIALTKLSSLDKIDVFDKNLKWLKR